ncbi:MAG: hypothetical protein ACRD3W_31975, partial [Terriglobales bacterium]
MILPGAPLSPNHFSGKAAFDNGLLMLDNIEGKLGSGTFRTSGKLLPGQSVDLTYDGTAIDLQTTRKMLDALKIKAPSILQKPFSGLVRHANMTIKGPYARPQVVIIAQPEDIYSQPFGKGRTFELTDGTLKITGQTLTLNKVIGKIGKGTFKLDGTTGFTPGAPIDISYTGRSVDVGTLKLALNELGLSTAFFNPAIAGDVDGAVGTIRGTVRDPHVNLSLVPHGILYQPLGTERMIELVGGRVDIVGPVLRFQRVKGLLGKGGFSLDGTTGIGSNHNIDVHFTAHDLDLSHVKVALLELNVHSPLLAEQLLFGRVRNVALDVKGKMENPDIKLACVPNDVLYEPIGSTRAMHLQQGRITYRNDVLQLTGVNVRSPRSRYNATLTIARLSRPDSQLKSLDVQAELFDITDLHSYLQAPKTPPAVRKQYLTLLQRLQMTPQRGKLRGHLLFTAADAAGDYNYEGDVVIDRVGITAQDLPLTDVSGSLRTDNHKLFLQNLTGKLGT